MGSRVPQRTAWVLEQRLALQRTIPYAGTFSELEPCSLSFELLTAETEVLTVVVFQ